MKGIYLIVVIITVALVANRMIALHSIAIKESEEVKLVDRAFDIMMTLTHDANCLAYEEFGNVEGFKIELGKHPVIDVNKLRVFASEYAESEPNCLIDYDYGYRIRVETLPLNMSLYEVRTGKGVFSKILQLINGKKVVFVVDVSGSMGGPGGEFCGQKVKKYQCLALFLAGLELGNVKKCTDIGFIDMMNDESKVSIIIYGTGGCGVMRIVDLTNLNGKPKREEIKKKLLELKRWAQDGTPIGDALKEGFEYAYQSGADTMVLLTDGWPNCGSSTKEVVKKYKSYNIPVYTIAFGVGAAVDLLEWVANETGGNFFDARSCEELLGKVEKIGTVVTLQEGWEFGDIEFSKEEALEDYVSVSIPVTVRYNSTLSIPGRMKILLVDGELERFVGFVEKVCNSGLSSEFTVKFSYPVNLKGRRDNYMICMNFGEIESCKRVFCEKRIEFDGIRTRGTYVVEGKVYDDMIKLIV